MSYKSLVENIIADNLDGARSDAHEILASITNILMYEEKCRIGNRFFSEMAPPRRRSAVRRVGRLNLVRIRIRRGKVQRRKKVSAVKGWTLRHGHMIRMRPSERLHRRLAARRAKIKRRAKKNIIRRKTRIAMRKRRALGLSYKPFGRS